MTQDDLSRIEVELSLELPECYRQFMLNYPDSLIEEGPSYGLDSPADLQILNSPDRVIELNQRAWASQSLEDDYFLIGEDGCGNYYGLDDDESPVHFWNHERGKWDDQEGFESIVEFAGHCLEMIDIYKYCASAQLLR